MIRLQRRAGGSGDRPYGNAGIVVCLGLVVGALSAAAGCAGRSQMTKQRQPFVRVIPETTEYVRLLAKPESVCLHSGLVTLAPGQECGWHSTEDHEELIICLAGAGEIATEGGGQRPLSAGHYAYNPPQTRHNVCNTGRELMRYIYVVAPAKGE